MSPDALTSNKQLTFTKHLLWVRHGVVSFCLQKLSCEAETINTILYEETEVK